MKTILFTKKSQLRRTTIFWLVILFILIEFITDSFIEHNIHAYSYFVLKDLVIFFFICTVVLLQYLKLISLETTFLCTIYSVIVSLIISIPLRVLENNVLFEIFFVKIVIISLVLIFATGLCSNSKHKIIISSLITAIIIVSAFWLKEHQIAKLLFYSILVGATSFITFKTLNQTKRLNKKLKQKEEYITQQNKLLKEGNDFKANIIKIIGHDLKAPMLHIGSLISLLDNPSQDKEQQQCYAYLKKSSEDANFLLDEILDWAKETSNKLSSTSNIDLHQLVDSIFTLYKGQALDKKIILINQVTPKQTIKFKRQSLEIILRNFISNTIQTSSTDKQIIVKNSIDKDMFIVSVFNNSISKEKANTITNRLQICSKLAKMYNASIELKQVKNSTIYILHIPIA